MDERNGGMYSTDSSVNSGRVLKYGVWKSGKGATTISTIVVFSVMGLLLEGCQSMHTLVEQSRQALSWHSTPTSEQRAAAERKNALAEEGASLRSTGIHAANACERFIRRRLRDPESIRFPSEPDSASVEKHLDGAYHATVEIHAIDRDDGATISYFDCQVVKVNEDWMLASLREHLPS